MCASIYLHKVYFRIKTIACTASYRCVFNNVRLEGGKWSTKSCFITQQFEHKIDYRISPLSQQNHHGTLTEDDTSIAIFIPMNVFTICHLSVRSSVIQLLFALIRVKAKAAIDLPTQITMHWQQLCIRLKWRRRKTSHRNGGLNESNWNVNAYICAC